MVVVRDTYDIPLTYGSQSRMSLQGYDCCGTFDILRSLVKGRQCLA